MMTTILMMIIMIMTMKRESWSYDAGVADVGQENRQLQISFWWWWQWYTDYDDDDDDFDDDNDDHYDEKRIMIIMLLAWLMSARYNTSLKM